MQVRGSGKWGRSSRARGAALILVMMSIAVAAVIGLTFLNGSATLTAIAGTMNDHAQARQIAESAAAMAVRYVEQTPDWHTRRTSGPWISDFALHGGHCSVTAAFDPADVAGVLPLNDASFEMTTGQLSNPVLFPPMSGAIGGWTVQRTAAVQTGATVPRVGVAASAFATDGHHLALVEFPLSVIGSATFSQTLAETLEPDSAYTLEVDAGRAGLALVLANVQIRVYAGGTLLASSADPSLLTLLDLDGDFKTYVLRFDTDSHPPAGNLRVELHAESLLGVLSGAAFDDVRLTRLPTDPLVLTATARYGDAGHRVTVSVYPAAGAGHASIVQWTEP